MQSLRACVIACFTTGMVGCSASADPAEADTGSLDDSWDSDSLPVQAALFGELSLWIELSGVGEDTCVGTIAVDVDTQDKPAFSGTAECVFGGSFSRLGALDGDLYGDFVGNGGDVEGFSTVSAPGQEATELPWSGVFDGESLRSDVEDRVVGDRFDINYRITFMAE